MDTSFLVADPVARALTTAGITGQCDDALARAKTLTEQIRARSNGDTALTWEQTFGAFDEIIHCLHESVQIPQLMSMAHPDEAVRAAALACEPKADAFMSALYMDDAIATVLKRFAQTASADLSPARQHFVQEVLRDYRRNGLELDAEGRERLRRLNEEILKLGQAFDKNLAETTLWIEVRPEQLDGLPETYIASHPPQDNGLIKITTNYPDLNPFLQYAKDRKAARELYILAQDRCADKNLTILDQLIALRHEKANLLGYATWADYVLEPRMAKSARTAQHFLDELHTALKPKREEEFEHFRETATTLGVAPTDPIFVSDAVYLEDRLRSSRFALDTQRLSQYFEVRAVQRGIMNIAERLYDISFQPVNVPTWHEDVTPFEVRDTATDKVIGRVYLDLYPRDNKYKHAAVFGLRETVKLDDGSRLLPLAALVCNFPKPGQTPALLSHEEVITFFHEFGHLLHHVLSESELAAFSGTCVQRDFVEAPSQMFEEWAWHRETLDLFAKHHATGERLPDELFNAMTAARTFGEATWTERQNFLSTLDQAYHTRAPGFDTSAVMESLRVEYSSFTPLPNTHFQASFGHLVGYDAAYYGYLWALSLAFDLLTRFESEGMMNQKTAAEYRAAILAPGGNAEGQELVTRFLGRAPNADAFKKYLGIS